MKKDQASGSKINQIVQSNSAENMINTTGNRVTGQAHHGGAGMQQRDSISPQKQSFNAQSS